MTTEPESLVLTPIVEIKAIVDMLADLGLDPLHLNIHGRKVTDPRPGVSMWMRYRTDYEAVVERLGAKSVERQYRGPKEREWYAEHDTDRRRLLVQCYSVPHHHDWIPREATQ